MEPVVECKVDWVSLTKRGFWAGIKNASQVVNQFEAQTVARQVLNDFGYLKSTLELAQAGKGYHYGFQEFASGIRVSVARELEKQGVMVQLSGSALDRIDDVGLRVSTALDSGYRCSRLDISFDIFGSGITADRVASEYLEAHPQATKRKRSLVSSARGSTFYIGSRYSREMLRCYDKGAQQRTAVDWLRVEVEFKREYIHQAAAALVMAPSGALHNVIGLLDMPKSLLVGILLQFGTDVPEQKIVFPRPTSDRELWFMTNVRKAFKGLLDSDPQGAKRVLDAFSEIVENGSDVKLL